MSPKLGLELLGTRFGQVHVAAVGVGVVILAGDEFAYQPDDFDLRRFPVAGASQHQRHQRLVDEHRIGLVDERHVGIGRHQVLDVGDQLVAQHVEPDLVDRGVGDVGLVRLAAFRCGRLGGDPADREAEGFDQRAHPFGVAPGQVVVDRDDVHVAPADGVAGRRDGARQRLALTRCHLDDVACQHPQRALQLNIERAKVGRPFRGLPGDRQELRDVIGLGHGLEVQQLCGLAQLFVVEVGRLLVEVRRRFHLRRRARLIPVGAGAEQLPESIGDTT